MSDRPTPLLGDVSLEAVQRIESRLEGVFVAARVAGLAGEVQQRSGRPSHRIEIAGVLAGDGAADALKKLQQAAAAGDEVTFASDITTALDLQHVVIDALNAVEVAGEPGRFDYRLSLVESPPLPPPTQVAAFGGLDDFGLGDLGFDTDVLGDLEGLAGEIGDVVDGALDALDQLQALASLGDLGGLGDFLEPLADTVGTVGRIGSGFGDAARGASGRLGGA